MIYQIIAIFGVYDGYSVDTLYTTIDQLDAQSRLDQFVVQARATGAALSLGHEIDYNDPIDSIVGSAFYDEYLNFVVMAYPLGVVGDGERVTSEELHFHDRYYTDHEALTEEAYNIPKPTRFEVMAQPFERKYFGWRH